ncbi:hypothetical protein [Deinococcus cellulosilyticus]|uniref:Shikimate 5-dehydrogenase n=1 Tax=Deinococcus cellulosilyticus (strain DSM 18568 / NBRC 106333 / KACC 11606 / 5516J-15) TaxID=1223518 RepID=A0A511N4Z4_DEIC1|nr:hypothetical protein [Deinococcus cellulosilyticus]GEM47547.1 shikimate 5-dehydrogenase [Deinococcus cellulosilyticus NBRC 106333 = KACC 11606]
MNSFAFLAYPRDVAQDLGRFAHFPSLKRFPEAVYEYALRKTSAGPAVIGQLTSAQHDLQGHVISLPLTPHQLRTLPVQLIRERVQEAIHCARDLGATVIGLGALTSERPEVGHALRRNRDISITGGGAYRTATVVLEIERLLKHLPKNPTVTLIGSDEVRLAMLSPVLENIHGIHGLHVTPHPEPARLREADLLVLLGDLPGVQIRSEHLRYNAIVLNAARSKVLEPRVLRERSDVILTDFSTFNPTIRLQGGPIHTHTLCPSLTETILLAQEGHQGHFALDVPTQQQLEYILLLLKKHPHQQFEFVSAQHRPARSTQVQRPNLWI